MCHINVDINAQRGSVFFRIRKLLKPVFNYLILGFVARLRVMDLGSVNGVYGQGIGLGF